MPFQSSKFGRVGVERGNGGMRLSGTNSKRPSNCEVVPQHIRDRPAGGAAGLVGPRGARSGDGEALRVVPPMTICAWAAAGPAAAGGAAPAASSEAGARRLSRRLEEGLDRVSVRFHSPWEAGRRAPRRARRAAPRGRAGWRRSTARRWTSVTLPSARIVKTTRDRLLKPDLICWFQRIQIFCCTPGEVPVAAGVRAVGHARAGGAELEARGLAGRRGRRRRRPPVALLRRVPARAGCRARASSCLLFRESGSGRPFVRGSSLRRLQDLGRLRRRGRAARAASRPAVSARGAPAPAAAESRRRRAGARRRSRPSTRSGGSGGRTSGAANAEPTSTRWPTTEKTMPAAQAARPGAAAPGCSGRRVVHRFSPGSM